MGLSSGGPAGATQPSVVLAATAAEASHAAPSAATTGEHIVKKNAASQRGPVDGRIGLCHHALAEARARSCIRTVRRRDRFRRRVQCMNGEELR